MPSVIRSADYRTGAGAAKHAKPRKFSREVPTGAVVAALAVLLLVIGLFAWRTLFAPPPENPWDNLTTEQIQAKFQQALREHPEVRTPWNQLDSVFR